MPVLKLLLFIVVLAGCSKSKKDQDLICITCAINPHPESEQEKLKQWEIANWERSCTRLANPYSPDYIGPKSIKNVL